MTADETTSPASCFFIAEAGVNHNGDLDTALKLVEGAAAAGADAVKFQTFKAERLVTPQAQKARYQLDNLIRSEKQVNDSGQFEMLRKLELLPEHHHKLNEHCAELGIEFMSTPFDVHSLQFLVEEVGVTRLKLGSGEIGNLPLLIAAGASGLPTILSSGMATLEELELSLGAVICGALGDLQPKRAALRAAHDLPEAAAVRERLWLLQCTTDYPAQLADLNLRTIPSLRRRFDVEVGFSDHSLGLTASIAAIALGAVAIEKHFTLSREMVGPDHAASLELNELKQLVAAVREVERALGSEVKAPSARELANVSAARKSLVALRPIAAGEPFTPETLGVLRPGGAVSGIDYWHAIGRLAGRNYAAFEALDACEVE